MKLIFAKKLGFCFGVKRAIALSEKILETDPRPIQFWGEIIHNEEVIKKIKKKGGKFISNPQKVTSGTLVIRAHGVAPFHPPKNVLIRDLTCPLVKKAQLTALSLFQKGYQVIIIGDKEHPEVKGIRGYTQNQAMVIENESEVKKLPTFEKIGVVSQTTQSFERVKKILKLLKKKVKKMKWINTLCPEVIFRQKEIPRIIRKVDGILVIGSHTSANTKELVKKIKSLKKRRKLKILWVNSLEELKKKKMKGISKLGLVSGTSAPDWEIEKIKQYLLNDD